MDNKKFEQLIDLIINENEDQARALFHDIVVEKSREIYESMMYADEGMNPEGGQIGDLLDEIEVEETQGMTEADDDFADIEMGDEEDMGDEDMGAEEDEEELEDRVVDLEGKLDQLMAEFEELMGSDEEDMGSEEDMDMGDEEDFGGEEDMGDEEMMEAADEEEDEEESLEESVSLSPVKGLYGSKIGGDDGANAKSVALSKPKLVQTGAKSVNFSQGDEKGRTAPTSQTVKGDFKNAAGIKGAKTETAPKPHTAQATSVNTKSPVAESKKSTKVRK